MAFRTVEINKPSEIHVKTGQLVVIQEEGVASIPIADINTLILNGPSIRLSAMDLAILAEKEVMVVFCGRNYRPQAILQPLDNNSRYAQISHRQVTASSNLNDELWKRLIVRKIENQARCLSILGKEGVSKVSCWANDVLPGDPLNHEACAALEYFPLLHDGLNRRTDDPINNILNYGYAIIRSALIKEIVATGFSPTFGLHHRNQYNSFNLADDLIEPFRPFIDVLAPSLLSSNSFLSKEQRHTLVGVLHHACLIDGKKLSVKQAVELEVDSLNRAIENNDANYLKTPVLIPVEFLEGVSE